MRKSMSAVAGVLCAVAVLGCGTETARPTPPTPSAAVQALLSGMDPMVTAKAYACYCMNGGILGDLLCANGTWSCIDDERSETGWQTSCSGEYREESDTDKTGQACSGNAYSSSDYPSKCPNLPNTQTNGKYECNRNPLADVDPI